MQSAIQIVPTPIYLNLEVAQKKLDNSMWKAQYSLTYFQAPTRTCPFFKLFLLIFGPVIPRIISPPKSSYFFY